MTIQKLTILLVFLSFYSIISAQEISIQTILENCPDCTKKILGAPSGLFLIEKTARPAEENLEKSKKCLYSKHLPKNYKYGLANRIAAMHAYRNDSRDSIVKYMNLAQSYEPALFCKDNRQVDFWIEEDNPEFFKNFHPMYIRYLSKDIWSQKLKECKSCCSDALKEATFVEKAEPETPSNQEYYDALKKISENDQKYRPNLDKGNNSILQADLDLQNRLKLDELYDKYGMPTKERVTSSGVGSAYYVMLHSTDCDWTKKWIIRSLDAQIEGLNTIEDIGLVISRFFYSGENSVYNVEEVFCDDAKEFLELLREKYPEEIAEKYKFNK